MVGPDGALSFGESSGNKIGRLGADGRLTEFPLPTPDSNPIGITAGPDGALWLDRRQAGQVGRGITTEGAITEFPLPDATGVPNQIVAGPDGALWFTQLQADRVGRLTPGGVLTEYPVPGLGPVGITVGPDRALWLTAITSNEIARLTPEGQVTHRYAIPTPASTALRLVTGPDGALWSPSRPATRSGSCSSAPPRRRAATGGAPRAWRSWRRSAASSSPARPSGPVPGAVPSHRKLPCRRPPPGHGEPSSILGAPRPCAGTGGRQPGRPGTGGTGVSEEQLARTYLMEASEAEHARLIAVAQRQADQVREMCARAGVGAGARIVDVGCGPVGALLELAEIAGPRGTVVGVDSSAEAVAAGAGDPRRARPGPRAGRARRRQRHGAGAVAGDGPFDAAYLRFVLVHQADPAATLRRVAALLRPGGRVLAADLVEDARYPRYDPPVPASERAWELLFAAARRRGAAADVGRRLPGLCAEAGLRVVDARGVFRVLTPAPELFGPDAGDARGRAPEHRRRRTGDRRGGRRPRRRTRGGGRPGVPLHAGALGRPGHRRGPITAQPGRVDAGAGVRPQHQARRWPSISRSTVPIDTTGHR